MIIGFGIDSPNAPHEPPSSPTASWSPRRSCAPSSTGRARPR
ncbi:hypothetical protein NKG05_03165 [Oerskovia sp. M15]